MVSWPFITVFFVLNVSEKSSDVVANNESWATVQHLFQNHDSILPGDSVISGLYFETLSWKKMLLAVKHGQEIQLCAESILIRVWITTLGLQKQGAPGLPGGSLILLYCKLVSCTLSYGFLWTSKTCFGCFFFSHLLHKCLNFSSLHWLACLEVRCQLYPFSHF